MSFKCGRIISLLLSAIIGSFFIIFGVFSLILPWSSYFQEATTQFFLKNTLIFSLFGLGFVLMGLSLIIYTSLQTRHHFIEIRTGDFSVNLDENVIKQYLETYWQEQFPKSHIPFDLTFKKKFIQIVANLPPLQPSDQDQFLEKVKRDLNEMFSQFIGYPNEVHLIASFQEKKDS